MKATLKILLVVTLVILGGLAGIKYTSPHDVLGQATTLWGVFDILCGALGGLFIGGMFVTFRA